MKNPFRRWPRTENQWMVFIALWAVFTFLGIMIPAVLIFK